MLGQVIRREQEGGTGNTAEVWYRYSGRQMGYAGNNGYINSDYAQTINQRAGSGGTPGSFADFDLAYDPINAYAQGSSGGMYTVQSGDTLASIASALWGDASLWWKLAEVNGLTAESVLAEGQPLIIPVGVQTRKGDAHFPNSAECSGVYPANCRPLALKTNDLQKICPTA
jgi:LysM repeat protein